MQPESVYAQLANAVQYHASLFGEVPRGIWLPECAYYQGVEDFLGELGVQYFITATHGVLYAAPRPKYGVYSPILTAAGVAAFGRDPETSKQVWSAQEGYPGDYDYREFYRDIAYDLPLDYIGPHLHPPGMRSDSGIKYYRITREGLAYKEPYRPEQAREKAQHAAISCSTGSSRSNTWPRSWAAADRGFLTMRSCSGTGGLKGPVARLLCRKIAYDQAAVKMITPGEYLDGYPLQIAAPNPPSWGDKGHTRSG